MFLPLSLAILLSLMLAGLLSLIVSSSSCKLFSQWDLGMGRCGTFSSSGVVGSQKDSSETSSFQLGLDTGSALDADVNQKDPIPGCSLVAVS